MSNPTKAAQYLTKLEDARCEGKWSEVPELVRKVRKHANDRNCITTAAEAEHAVVQATLKNGANPGPAVTASPTDLETERLVSKLLAAADAEQTYLEERFQAQVCAGWAHWTVGEYDLALSRLSTHKATDLLPLDRPDGVSEWTRVCAVKAAYLKAYCLMQNNKTVEALLVFENSMSYLSHVWSGQKGRSQLRFWTELLLTEYCMLQAAALERGDKRLEEENSLAPFRSWARYWEVIKVQGAPLAGGVGVRGGVPRRRVWNEYYLALSGILQLDLPFSPAHVGNMTTESSARNQLRIELKKVETAYEGLLLNETTFPRADEQREEVELLVAVVMKNWNVLVGRDWHEYDLGPGGKEGLSRGVLDLLYRAATKTFHSTAILRSLFTIHLAVAEFELAFHAFDSYLEIVKRGKARVDKTGHPEPSLDDDPTMLETMSQAIIALCKYGFDDVAEKAYHLGVELEEMLQKLPPPLPSTGDSISTVYEENGNGHALHPRVPARIYGLSWQAIGLSQAHWSRITFDASIRTDLQTKAIRSLHKSLSPEAGNPTDTGALFTLTVLLAEQRKLTAAIDIVKAALMSSSKAPEDKHENNGPYWRERSLIPLWHLLALLLSAREDYVMAARACEAAFEQFKDPEVLFGSQSLQASFRSQHLNEAEALNEKEPSPGLVDEMDDLEKEGIIEVKMTQLALLKLLEGPEVAVNASHELLVLYTRLFGSATSRIPTSTLKTPNPPQPPHSSSGTLRSIRGSIFGHHRDREHRRGSLIANEKSIASTGRPQTAQTVGSSPTTAPSILVTKEGNGINDSPLSGQSPSVRGRRGQSARRNSLKKREGSQRARSSSGARVVPEAEVLLMSAAENGSAVPGQDSTLFRGRKTNSSPRAASKNRASVLSTNKDSVNGTGSSAAKALTCPNPLPTITFPNVQVQRHRRSLLVKVWLMIASFYRRAEMYGDAKGAIGEAEKGVEDLEGSIAKDTTGTVSSRNPGWGGRVCLDELYGDVQTEMGLLALDQGLPFVARDHFEEALMRYPDHPAAIVGLSNILLDIYTEVLLPAPSIPSIIPGEQPMTTTTTEFADGTSSKVQERKKTYSPLSLLPTTPLGLGGGNDGVSLGNNNNNNHNKQNVVDTELPAPYKAVSLPLIDRLAARDRAYGLLSGMTKLGTGWRYADAWFALARAHEESGQVDRAKEALWWCVELEEGTGIRDWFCVVGGRGYVL
ncbi:hypothetical protein F5Y17DRAFT_448610 [Xylariaceae sp. FL0594]|nr:hypothetical protein F5Y17DRAFT_448610 [Xylariaceae sp. FL0594]